MKKIICAIAFFVAFSSQSRAEIMVASSVEWLSCNSEIVVVGKIKQITTTKGIHSVIYEDCIVQVDEVLKGDIKDKQITFCLRTLSTEPTAKAFMNSKEGVLLFLSKSTDHGRETHLDNKLVPSSNQLPLSIIDLSSPPKHMFNIESKVLSKGKNILAVCRKALSALKKYRTESPKKEIKRYYLKVPFDAEAHKQLYAGSSCYLYVPDFMSQESKERFY